MPADIPRRKYNAIYVETAARGQKCTGDITSEIEVSDRGITMHICGGKNTYGEDFTNSII